MADSHSLSVVALLDKVRRLYPVGIPTSALASGPSTVVKPAAPTATFFLIHDSTELEPSLTELLRAICVKGLRLQESHCSTHLMLKASTALQEIESAVSQSGASLRIVLGSEKRAGATERDAQGIILYSHPLARIASDAAIKRDFWSHLQGALAGA